MQRKSPKSVAVQMALKFLLEAKFKRPSPSGAVCVRSLHVRFEVLDLIENLAALHAVVRLQDLIQS